MEGECVLQNQKNVFSFYLDESLWFKEGQGVRELIGISLEPEISIEELGEEIRLKGTVELAGEYVPSIDSKMESSASPSRLVDEVVDGEEGSCVFSHSFPVEITVPLNRVARMDDVLVNIESFDYELPASHQLRLHAQLDINGIEQSSTYADSDINFDEAKTIGPIDYDNNDEKKTPVFPEREAPIIQLNQEREKEEAEEGRWPNKKSQSFSEFFEKESENQTTETSPEILNTWEDNVSSLEDIVSSSSVSQVNESVEKEAPTGMDGIKQIFKHLFPNREDSYTQMKMYITQEEETLESIAAKYGVSVKQLERVNQFEEDIAPGQIVYIPN